MSREFGRPPASSRTGDQLAEAPDGERPSNPWPRLLAFFGVVGLSVVLVGYCAVSFASPPPRELKVEVTAVDAATPRFLPVTNFGADRDGFTFGAFLVLDPTGPAYALLSQAPESNCNLTWDATARAGDDLGAFVDRCSSARYDMDGVALHESATRDLHRFAVSRTTLNYVVDMEAVRLGTCRTAEASGCSQPDEVVEVTVPKSALPAGFPAD
ncbi:MAG: hypothetical protein Q8M79_11865 [Dehalococcoidia bacterium]|nr:hypothetical protein [Dehalococcoidia bacterium]